MKKSKNIIGRIQYNSPVTLTFALASLLVLLLHYATGEVSTNLLFSIYQSSWTDPLTYLRIFGHVLGHAGWSHYTSNMVLFLVLGPILEEKYGSKVFFNMIAVTAIVSGILHIVMYPDSALLGASGVVFMMIVLSSAAGMENGRIPITLILVVIIYLGNEVISGFTVDDGIAHMAHVAGGICGAGFGFLKTHKR